ncbi:MAG: VCBS repeat-containing protein [Nannocystaceae bacterium]
MTRCHRTCAGLLLGVAAGACYAFPELELGRCGNGIIEAAEDCDDQDPEHCSACYLVCSPGVSTTGCPEDRVCGRDGRCRAASGRFALDPIRIVHAGTQWLEVGDLDGDGRADAVVQLDGELDAVHLAPQQTLDLGLGLGRAAIGDLDGDGRDEVLFAHVGHALDPDARGLSLLREVARDDDTRVVAADTLPTLRSSGSFGRLLRVAPAADRVLELVQPQASFAWHRGSADAIALMPAMPIDPTLLGRALPSAALDLGAAPCSDAGGEFARPAVVIAESGATAVRVFASCGGALPFELDTGATVTLPTGATLGAAGSFLVEVDGDGHLDLVVQSDSGAVWTAYGLADGSFGDSPGQAAPGNGRFDPTPLLQPESAEIALLAVAQLDDDDAPELVTSAGFVADPLGCADDCTAAWPQPLREAVVLDFDDDGVRDLVALESGALTLRLGLREGDAVSFTPPHVLAALDDAESIAVGDFDHDTVDDVAVIERSAAASVRLVYGGDAEPWQSTVHGPFAQVQSLAVDADGTVLARTLDGMGRPRARSSARARPPRISAMPCAGSRWCARPRRGSRSRSCATASRSDCCSWASATVSSRPTRSRWDRRSPG